MKVFMLQLYDLQTDITFYMEPPPDLNTINWVRDLAINMNVLFNNTIVIESPNPAHYPF